MEEKYHLPLLELSATQREEYNRNIDLLLEGYIDGLKGALSVLQNSKPAPFFSVPLWAKDVLDAYKNIGRIVCERDISPEKMSQYEEYKTVLSGELSEQGILSTLEDLLEIKKKFRDLLDRYEGQDNLDKIRNALTDLDKISGVMGEFEISDSDELEERLGKYAESKEQLDKLKKDVEGLSSSF